MLLSFLQAVSHAPLSIDRCSSARPSRSWLRLDCVDLPPTGTSGNVDRENHSFFFFVFFARRAATPSALALLAMVVVLVEASIGAGPAGTGRSLAS